MTDSSNSRTASYASHACTRCSKRKIKCERLLPECLKCKEAKADCIYVAPSAPRRRKRKESPSTSAIVVSKLKKYEELLQANGISVPDITKGETRDGIATIPGCTTSTSPTASSPTLEQASVKTNDSAKPSRDDGDEEARSYGGNRLWTGLVKVRDKAAIDGEDNLDVSQGFMNDQPLHPNADPLWGEPIKIELQSAWPRPEFVSSLCQTYLTRFNPIYKVLHGPSVTRLAIKATMGCGELLPTEQALLCAVFATAVYTMSEDECRLEYGEERAAVLRQYRLSARIALSNANYLLSTNMMVLQAFVIFLRSLRYDFDSSPLWSLMGIALRNGKRIGLDRPDELSRYSPLERQERQVLWFNMTYMDAWFAEVAGAREPWAEFRQDFGTPLNLNDEDLDDNLSDSPPEREGATDVMFTLLRCDWVRGTQKTSVSHRSMTSPDNTAAPYQDQIKAIDQLEELFERKYVRHCDPTVPMQFWILLTAKCMIAELRLAAHRPNRGRNAGQEDVNALFSLSIKALEYEYMGQVTESLQIFRWHQQDQIPRMAVIFVVAELRKRTVGPEVDRAWVQIERTFSKHPEIVTQTRRSWIWHLGSLVLEAWAKREAGRLQNGLELIPPPDLILQLRNRPPRSYPRLPRSGQTPSLDGTEEQAKQSSLHGSLSEAGLTPFVSGFGDGLWDPDFSLTGEDGGSLDYAAEIDWSQWDIPIVT